MTFQPDVKQELIIDDVTYLVAEHPAAPGMPYGQEGRQSIVYQLVASSPASGEGQGGGLRALKVFKARYRVPALVTLADRIAAFADLPGLSVCRRTVLSARRHGDLLRQHPGLLYAVLMPWVEGPTWMEVMLEKRKLSSGDSLALARSLAEILAGMEEHGLAHCDLSGPNVMLPYLTPAPNPLPLPDPERGRGPRGREVIALVDVEQLYGPGLTRPEALPGGSPGYAHKTAPQGLWGATADRFAGAVLLAEMLGWCDERVRGAAWGENYFDPQEMQQESERNGLLIKVLRERWGDGVASLFERAWRSETLTDCPTFGEWLVMLPEDVPVMEVAPIGVPPEDTGAGKPATTEDTLRVLMDLGRQFEEQGKLDSAQETYRQALALAPAGSGLMEELALIVRDLEARQRQEAEDADLACLFDEGMAAYERGEWARTKELLAEVVRRQPNYARGGQQAAALLAKTEKRLIPLRTRMLGWAWALGGLALLALIVGLVWGVNNGWSLQARATPTEVVVRVTATDTATPTHTSTPTPTNTPLPGAVVVPLENMAHDIPWLTLGENAVPATFYYAFNVNKPPFDNRLVRQAFTAAVDRQSVADLANALGSKNARPAITFTPPETLGRDLYGQVGLPFDPAQARALLAEAGYPDGQGFPVVTLVTNRGRGLEQIAGAIVSMWQENLGVSVRMEGMDDWQAYLDLLARDAPAIYRLGWAADFNDPDNFLREVFHSRSEHNRGHFSNAEFDRLVEQAAELRDDPAMRQVLYIQAERILCEDQAAIIPLYHYWYSP